MNNLCFGKVYTNGAVSKINDQRDTNFDPNEKNGRCKLASLFHIFDLYGWNNSINNNITLKLSEDNILINPYGLLPWEITASKLIRTNFDGNIVNQGFTKLIPDQRLLQINCAVYNARKDAGCIVHLNMPYILAISATTREILPLSSDAIIIGNVSYHSFQSDKIGAEEMKKMLDNLGPVNKILFLRNEGIFCIGATIEEAFYLTYHTVCACQTQILCSTNDNSALNLLQQSKHASFGENSSGLPEIKNATKEENIGVLEYEAHMRYLDKIGHCTGYTYTYEIYPKSMIGEPISASSVTSSSMLREDNYSPIIPCSERRNSDSGVALFNSRDERFFHEDLDSFKEFGFCDDLIPSSESTKELMMRKSLMLNDTEGYSNEDEFNKNLDPASSHRRHKSLSRNHTLIKRSKSLTSGVEKAIFRKNSEKYLSERKGS